uniref:glucuronokinase n=1 Tax=Physcomitrium patens TaxID=3218 RepID=A0A7I4CFQ9_PHYPA
MMKMKTPGKSISHRAYARIGFLGNPSDAYYGNTLAVAIGNFGASVTLEPSDTLVFRPHPVHDPAHFTSLQHLVARVEGEGYYGGVRLLMAICKVFHAYCEVRGIILHDRNFTLSYDTNVPRQAGLSGSSAIVCAALSCLLEFFNVGDRMKVEDRPKVILSAEEELGITAGLQDRVAQVYGGLVYMDFDKATLERTGNGIYTPMDPKLLPQLYLIYTKNPSDSGKVHSTVRKRWLDGDELVRNCMKEVASLAVKGRDALLRQDFSTIAKLMDTNFDLQLCLAMLLLER